MQAIGAQTDVRCLLHISSLLQFEDGLRTPRYNRGVPRWFVSLLLILGLTCAYADDADSAFARGVRLQQAGDWDGAIREYRACLTQNPGKLEAHSNLGVALAHTAHYPEAVE